MRHKKTSEKLGRPYSLRKATLRDLAKSVLIYQSVITTRKRAKVARRLIDRLISLGRQGTLAGRRQAFAILGDHQLVKVLFTDIAPRYRNRSGGFTRIMHLLSRRGDGASQAVLELTEKVIKEKIKKEKPKKGETKPQTPEVKGEIPAVEEKPLPEPQPQIKEKPVVKKQKPERPKPVAKPKPKVKAAPEPKKVEKPQKPEAQPGKGLFGKLGRLFKRQKDSE